MSSRMGLPSQRNAPTLHSALRIRAASHDHAAGGRRVTVALMALALAAAPMHAFRLGHDWVVLDDSGTLVARHSPITEETILDGDVSPDGSFFVFSVSNPEDSGRLVRWQAGTSGLRLFVEERGFYGAPRFSRDGAWLFVAHYPVTGGAPGAHAPMEYAQLYRVNVASGQMQRLTASNGCHMSSFSTDGRRVIFGHSTCRGQKHIEALSPGKNMAVALLPAEQRIAEEGGLLDEPSLSPDGSTLVFTKRNGNEVELIAETQKQRRVLFAGPAYGLFRPSVTMGNTVLFQHGSRVLSVSLLSSKSLTVLVGG